MFKKLKNRFLILNLVIISVMMFLSFASIYFITYQNVHKSINDELDKTIALYNKSDNNFAHPHSDSKGFKHGKPDKFEQLSERSVSFSLLTDKKYNILSKASSFNIEDTMYETARKAVILQKKTTGTLKLNSNNWAYTINSSLDGYRIVFVDITSEQGILTSMIYTFIIIAFIMIIFIYFISRFFANKSIKPVKDAFEKQQQFIADASHEFKTPLTVINTNVDVLLANSDDTIDNQSKWLYYIKSEADRMAKLSNDLLYLTQMDTSNDKMISSDFDYSEIVENVILTMEALIFEHNITLNYDIEPELVTHGVIEQLSEVIMILLDNALKYTNKEGSVDISLKKRNNDIVFCITNTGTGISGEHLGRIFDRFYRTDKSRARNNGGYGLGLAIARSIIHQHKGKIYAKSIVNEHTSFYIELPLVQKKDFKNSKAIHCKS